MALNTVQIFNDEGVLVYESVPSDESVVTCPRCNANSGYKKTQLAVGAAECRACGVLLKQP